MIELWYVNAAKIDLLYSQTTDRVEKEREEASETTVTAKGSLSFGKLLAWIGLPLTADASVENESAKSTKVISVLSPAQKLEVVAKWARMRGQLSILVGPKAIEVEKAHRAASELYFVREGFKYDSRTKKAGQRPKDKEEEVARLMAKGAHMTVSVHFSLSQLVSQTYNVLLELERERQLDVLGFGSIFDQGKRRELELNPIVFGAGFCESWDWLCGDTAPN